MNKSAIFLWLIILTLICIISSSAQNNIAFVNKHTFYDEKNGVSELVILNKELKETFKPLREELDIKIERIKILQQELEDSSKCRIGCPSEKWVEEKLNERDKLAKDIQLKTNKANRTFKDKEKPVITRISEKLVIFAKLKKYEKIFDLSETELEDSDLLYTNDPIDVTEEFIKFCNEEFEKEKIQKQ